LLDLLSIPDSHILGISFGGFVAMDFALRYPDRSEASSCLHRLASADRITSHHRCKSSKRLRRQTA
jgi:pimeloyl-ACP methyl ester carboxylesterase